MYGTRGLDPGNEKVLRGALEFRSAPWIFFEKVKDKVAGIGTGK
jgi:hypothetical protein